MNIKTGQQRSLRPEVTPDDIISFLRIVERLPILVESTCELKTIQMNLTEIANLATRMMNDEN